MEEEYFNMLEELREAYNEEMLIACQNGKPCSYGICDECPNIIGDIRSNIDDE
jgi:hypothetical protein